jgi:small subunit ribosomal protein S16
LSVKIKLARIGAKGQPSYRVVIADERSATSGRVIEVIGHYNPLTEPSSFSVDKEKTLEWIKKGAIPTDTVRKMLGKIGVLKAIDFSASKKRAPKGAEAAKEGSEAKPAAAAVEEKK